MALQAAVQGLGFLAGIVVIRCLSPREYAFYTVVTAGLGTMTVLTDSGVNSSVFALGGPAWQDPARFGAVLATGVSLRKRFAYAALVIAVPLMAALLHRQGCSWVQSALIAASIVPAFLATVTGHLLETVPRLHQRLMFLQIVQMATNAMRVLLTALVVPFWPAAAVAALIGAIPQWWANFRLRRFVDRRADWRQPSNPRIRIHMLQQVHRTLPGAVYYALSGQITIWLISVFGKSDNVAAVGALSRLAMILGVLGTAFGALAVPRFARLPADPVRIRRRYVQAQLALVAACGLPLAFLWLLPGPALSILGPHYGGLQRDALLMAASSTATIGCGAAYGLGSARGVIAPPVLTMPITILLQVLLVAVLPLDTVGGVIWIGLLSAVGQWLVHFAYFEWRHRRPARVAPVLEPAQPRGP